MKPYASLKANERVLGTLSPFASASELENLGDLAVGAIGAELAKAGLASEDRVDDVLQCTLQKAWGRCSDGKDPIRSIRSYLLVVSRHEARRYMRPIIREERTQRLASDWVKVMAGEIPLPEEPLQDERPILLEALSRLSPRNRRIVRWLMIEELSDAEIKVRLGLKDGAFRTAKHRARKAFDALRDTLAGRGQDERRR